MLSIRRPSQPVIAEPARRLLQDTVIYGAAVSPPLPPPPLQPIQNQYPHNRLPQSTPPSFGDDANHFNPSVAIIMVVLLSAFFFMGFFSLYVRRCADGPSTEGRNSLRRGGELYHDHPDQGIDPDILQKLPLVAYSSAKKKGNNVECVVCLTEFEEQEPLRQLPVCKHVFHQDCIDMWLFSHSTCPLCRRNISMSNGSISLRWGGSGSFRDHIPFLSRGSSAAAQNLLPAASEEQGTLSLIQSNRSVNSTVTGICRSFSAEIPSAINYAGSRCAGERYCENGSSTLQSSSNVRELAGNTHTLAGNGGRRNGDTRARRPFGTHLSRANSTGHCLQMGLPDDANFRQPLPI